MSGIDAVVAGHFCVDVYPDLSAFPSGMFFDVFSPGKLLIVGGATFSIGGTVSNTGQALHKLGVDTRLIGRVGDDELGQVADNILLSNHPTLRENMVRGEEGTSYTIVINPPGVDRMFFHHPGSNDKFSADDVDYDLVAKSRLFHFGYPPLMRLMYEDEGNHLVELLRRAKETGATVSVDMALPDPNSPAGKTDWRKILDSALPYVDVFLPSIEEIAYMVKQDLYREWQRQQPQGDLSTFVTPENVKLLGDEIINRGVKIAVIKLGEHGLYARTVEENKMVQMGRAQPSNLDQWVEKEIWSACYQVDVVGTAGSGDATIAGFLAAMLKGGSLEDAVDMGVAVGACCVEAADTQGGIQTWEETRKRIDEGWKKHSLGNKNGWQYKPDQKLFERVLTRN